MTKKDKITIWITTILIFIFSLIGILASIGLLTKKITFVKAETNNTYKINIPQTITLQAFTELTQSTIEYNTQNGGIMECTYNNKNYTITKLYIHTDTISGGYNGAIYQIVTEIEINNNYYTASNLQYAYKQETNTYEYQYNTQQQLNTSEITTENIISIEWYLTNQFETTINTNETINNKFRKWITYNFIQEIENKIQLQAPTLTITNNTLQWDYIENANYYNVFMNGNLIGQTEWNTWATIQNGTYTVQACTNDTENYSNSEISNAVIQNNYNDLVGNGVNWFTFFSAFVDSQIFLIKSLLNYTIWDINFFQLFCFIITIGLAIMIIKFIKGW